MTDEFYMKRALRLAKRGEKWVSPNPMVGAVIVKGNRIIGEGYHQRFGEDHAEINAIRSATESIEGATVYIILEPCCHHGKTPPCVENLIARKPARVVIGMPDPNPLVCGGSIERLNQQGIPTTVGILADERLAVARHRQPGIERVDGVQRAQELADRVGAVAVVVEQRDPPQDVVAGDQQSPLRLEQADVGGRVPRSLIRNPRPQVGLDLDAVDEIPVGLDHPRHPRVQQRLDGVQAAQTSSRGGG